MSGSYELRLVALSIAVAILASYTALELAGRVSDRQGRRGGLAWLLGGAVAMGAGIWSMHFIGMLAFHLPVALAYDAAITMASMGIAIVVSGIALWFLRRPRLSPQNLATGAALMGTGICAMHYTGMAAMRMSPAIEYAPALFMASVLIAIGASLAALWIAFQLRSRHSGMAVLAKIGSAVVMGLAITGMHYTGMAAAQFAPGSICMALDSTGGMTQSMLATLIGVTTVGGLALTLVISTLDAHFAAHTAKLAGSLQEANEELRNLALYDPLTKLPNRMLLEDRMTHAIAAAERRAGAFALMFVDLDKFKPVNDAFGHGVGDALLRAVAQRIAGCVRKSDTVARVGGDEFVILLGEVRASDDAGRVGGKVLEELSRPFHVEQHRLEISCSIGISVYPADGRDVGTLMIRADAAMYHAKREGRNGCRFFAAGMTPKPVLGAPQA
jgi:diguanylate cyclase (GGDEF)-like protein